MSIVLAILALCVIIIIHELGHFGAAKLFKMNAYQFNLGMGPIIWKKQHKETQYALRILPIGGSVALGDDDVELTDDPNDYRNKPVWQRIIVIAAGAILNLVLGLILCVIIYAAADIIPTPVVSSDCGASGLRENDKIVKVEGMTIVSASEIFFKMDNSIAKKGGTDGHIVYDFVVIRDGKKMNLEATFEAEPNERGGMTYKRDFSIWGIGKEDKTFFNVLNYSARNAVGYGRIVWLSLVGIINGTYGLNEISGPVGIVEVVGEMAKQAVNVKEIVMSMLSLAALITINLGIVNLLPIPALDGAKIIFLCVEGVRQKPNNPNVEGMIHFAGFALLMLLIVVVTFNDVRKLITGG